MLGSARHGHTLALNFTIVAAPVERCQVLILGGGVSTTVNRLVTYESLVNGTFPSIIILMIDW